MRSASSSIQDKTTNNFRVQTNPACAYRGYWHECTLLANKLSKLKFSRFRWMPKLVLKSRKPLEQTQIVTGSQDISSIQSSLDVGHDVSPRACAVFVNVAGSHMTFIACHRALLTYSTMLAHLGPFHRTNSTRTYYKSGSPSSYADMQSSRVISMALLRSLDKSFSIVSKLHVTNAYSLWH